MVSRSLLARGVTGAATLAAARSALQAAVPRALPSQAAHRGLLSISRFSTGITEVRASPLGAMRAPTGSGLGWAGMAGEGARRFISTGPLHAETLKQAQDGFRAREAVLQEEVRQLREQVSILKAPVASLKEAAAGEEPLPLLEPRLARLEAQVASLEGRDRVTHREKDFAKDQALLAAEGKKLLAVDAEALLKAAEEGDVAKIHQIVDAGGDVDVKVTGERGRTPLHLAAWNGDEAAIKALVAAKADVHAEDEMGRTPLHYAAENGHEAAIKALVATKADVHAEDEDGDTPLQCAVLNGNTSAVQLLRELGATA
ncbi:ankyrin repeat-containing domain protein [Baffinella frigidus]|nr:ankyrin repeat-containing domain protein [Cryptophyta sp. CCMP2293]